ncbi:hypothetical protein C1752_03614 [Acaryochloris thomasi RCC1774]|uniref:DUF4126 domain-containing protein n=1 Tax=Acaryochloris thomasi RCC1774 TaxID=1764569 RepID=A0A2W1JNL3_9CYAN|nr:DUF4126 domain-containing protein [Acaryochloris thomasi]PZD72462.1 hypothetical protein C1752_03614 [Acaryochloris thomasi RCC1774]
MDVLIGLCLGITLSAACGLRIFIPPLILSIAALIGDLQLLPSLQWLGTYPALMVLATATVIEILAYYVPGISNLLDLIEIPTAIAIGTVLTAASLGDLNPVLQWSLALLAGGGSAGIVESATAATRFAANTLTVGTATPVVSTAEAGLSVLLTLLGLALPLFAATAVILIMIGLIRKAINMLRRARHKRREAAQRKSLSKVRVFT